MRVRYTLEILDTHILTSFLVDLFQFLIKYTFSLKLIIFLEELQSEMRIFNRVVCFGLYDLTE